MRFRTMDQSQRSEGMQDSRANLDRRELLARAIWGSVGAAAVLAAVPSETEASNRKTVLYEVAGLGNTFTFIPAPGATDPATNWRGTTFFVEGDIYPRDTIPFGVMDWDPSSATPIGHWLARGWFINRTGRPGEEDRPEPPSVVHNEFLIGRIVPDNLFPADQLTSSGLGGSSGPGGRPVHSVVGGTGRYLASQGAVTFHSIGANITGAPNFVCDFRLVKHAR